ncbi:MAG: hypothetical protein ABR512_10420, partial [Desulfopila sp.]
ETPVMIFSFPRTKDIKDFMVHLLGCGCMGNVQQHYAYRKRLPGELKVSGRVRVSPGVIGGRSVI